MGDTDLAGQVLTFLMDVMMLHHFLSRMFNAGASGSFEGFKFNPEISRWVPLTKPYTWTCRAPI